MKQLDRKAIWLFFLKSALPLVPLILFLIIVVVFVFIFSGYSRDNADLEEALSYILIATNFIWVVVGICLLFAYVWARLVYHFYRYELIESGFRKESGVILKKYVTIPYNRIQNIDISRGIVERLLGLSTLHIQTAGASGISGAEGRLPGLSRETAEQLRNELVMRLKQSGKNQGL